ncbi:MAG: DUF4249 domain-containing protein [Flavobacteriales bacterium]
MKKYTLFQLFALTVLLISCTKEIDFDLNEEGFDRLVVEGFITNQVKAHEVRLSRTTSYYIEQSPKAVSGAIVNVSNGVHSWVMTEDPIGSGRYSTPTDAFGIVGQIHELSIETDGQTYIATDEMAAVATLDSVTVEYELFEFPDKDEEFPGFWNLNIWTMETPETENFYRWRTFINGVTSSDTIRFSSFSNDQGLDGANLTGYTIEEYAEDEMEIGDLITLEQHGISRSYYDMLQAVTEQTEIEGGLFDPPAANVLSNVSNGALGFFSASSVSTKTYLIEE